MIISILAGLILGVAAVAGETARESHTRNIVTRLHTLLVEYYGTYKTRRVQLRQQIIDGINSSAPPNARGGEGQVPGLRPAVRLARIDADGSSRPLERLLLNAVPADPTGLDRRPLSVLPGHPRELSTPGERRWRTSICAAMPQSPTAQIRDRRAQHARGDSEQPRRRVPVHGHHAGHGRRRGPLPVRRERTSATPTATVRSSSSTAGDTRSISSAGRRASIRRFRSTRTSCCRLPGRMTAWTIGRGQRITIRSTCFASIRPRSAWCR